jgi:hypothetical protein
MKTYFRTNFSIIKPIVKKAMPTIKKFQLIKSGKLIKKLTPIISIPKSSKVLEI